MLLMLLLIVVLKTGARFMDLVSVSWQGTSSSRWTSNPSIGQQGTNGSALLARNEHTFSGIHHTL